MAEKQRKGLAENIIEQSFKWQFLHATEIL